ncbi:MAG TPA: hypothetical protein VK776_00795 [Bryobacteraceae bacterium]|jgi:hypothetical protein|nr:hypothetical protein [Bryobacteraceae bacterium]
MKWFNREKRVWALLGTACAHSNDLQYPSGEKHAFLVMVSSDEKHVQGKVIALLNSNGWNNVSIERVKTLHRPFHNDDPDMIRCYEAATLKDGGIIIYSDPILDLPAT